MKRSYEKMIGQTFGKLTVLAVNRISPKHTTLTCECSCEAGKITKPRASKVRSGHTRSCGCFAAERARRGNVKHGLTRNYRVSTPYYLWHNAKMRAKKKGIPFDILATDIAVPEKCPVLDIPLKVVPNGAGGRDCSPTLDRLKPSAGYVRGNVAVMSYRANRIKSDSDPDELRRVADWLEAELKK